MTAPALSASQNPTLRRRMASLLYEALVLFGVALIAGAIGALMLRITGTPQDTALRIIAFLLFGSYFTWFWVRQGQTLPMQTWQLRLVAADGGPVTFGRACLRYVLGIAWVAPGALIAHALLWPPRTALMAVGVNILVYGLLALWLPQRQFLHDLLAGTRIVNAPRQPRPSAA